LSADDGDEDDDDDEFFGTTSGLAVVPARPHRSPANIDRSTISRYSNTLLPYWQR